MHLEDSGAETIDEANDNARGKRHGNRKGRVYGNQDRRGKAQRRTDRKIDTTAYRNDKLSERNDHQRRDLAVHVRKILQAEEIR